MDGDIDYSKFTRAELNEALTRIDRARYPKNLSNLLTALAAAPVDRPGASTEQSSVRWERIFGWYFIVAAAVVAMPRFAYLISEPKGLSVSGSLSAHDLLTIVPVLIVVIALLALPFAAGIALIRGHRFGRTLGIASFAAQLVALSVPGISYSYIPLLAFRVFYTGGTFGFTGSMGPEMLIRIGSSEPIYIAVDAAAIVAIIVLAKLRLVRRAG
jgi:hypothetical protein